MSDHDPGRAYADQMAYLGGEPENQGIRKQQTNPVPSEECPHGAYESEHEDGACPCFPGVVVNPVPSEVELDALVKRLPQHCQCFQRPTFADPPCDVCKAAAAITALRDWVKRLELILDPIQREELGLDEPQAEAEKP